MKMSSFGASNGRCMLFDEVSGWSLLLLDDCFVLLVRLFIFVLFSYLICIVTSPYIIVIIIVIITVKYFIFKINLKQDS